MWTSGFSSSYVLKFMYDDGKLFVGYKDAKGRPTVVCQYDNIPIEFYHAFLTAPSKGKFVNQHIRPLPYKIVG